MTTQKEGKMNGERQGKGDEDELKARLLGLGKSIEAALLSAQLRRGHGAWDNREVLSSLDELLTHVREGISLIGREGGEWKELDVYHRYRWDGFAYHFQDRAQSSEAWRYCDASFWAGAFRAGLSVRDEQATERETLVGELVEAIAERPRRYDYIAGSVSAEWLDRVCALAKRLGGEK